MQPSTMKCGKIQHGHAGLAFAAGALCLFLCGLAASDLAAQAPPSVGDTVRVRTPLAVTVGQVLLVFPDSLIIAHRDRRFASPLTLSPGMLQDLSVKLGPRNRVNAALFGAAAGAAFTAIYLVAVKAAAGPDAHWGKLHPSSNLDRLLLFGPTVGGAVIGLSLPSARWRAARLPGSVVP